MTKVKRKYLQYLWAIGLVLCLAPKASPQQSRRDSLRQIRDTARTYYLDYDFFHRYALMQYKAEDTTMNDFRFFDPAVLSNVMNSSLGNLGSPINPIIFRLSQRPGFDIGMHGYDAYQFTDENAPFYLTLRPTTRLTYFLGMGSEQMLDVMHTQRILPDLQLGLQYKHINSDGYYLRQGAVYHNFRFFGRYNTSNRRYKLIFQFIHNELSVLQNGGLINDTNFIDDAQVTNPSIRKNYFTALDSAADRWYNNQITIEHAYTFDRRQKDTITFDERPLFTLMHRFHYDNRENRYRDGQPDTAAYPQIYFDSSFTRNSVFFQTVDNEFKAMLYMRRKFKSHSPLTVGIRHQYIQVENRLGYIQGDTLETDSAYHRRDYHNLSLSGSIRYDIAEQLSIEGRAWYYFAGYNRNDFQASFSVLYASRDSARVHHTLEAFAHFRLYQPAFTSALFASNHYQWQNTFSKQQMLDAGLSYTVPEWNLGVLFHAYLLNQYIYFDQQGQPQQSGNVNSVFTLDLHKRFRAWKFYFDNRFIGQYSSSDVIRVPYFTGRFSFYFQGYLFKRALLLNLGFDITYNTPYKALAYDPNTAQFRLQDEITTGNYPYLDVFLTAKIKTVVAYVRLRNTNQRWPDVPYFITPHYPMQDRTLQFGITWKFLN